MEFLDTRLSVSGIHLTLVTDFEDGYKTHSVVVQQVKPKRNTLISFIRYAFGSSMETLGEFDFTYNPEGLKVRLYGGKENNKDVLHGLFTQAIEAAKLQKMVNPGFVIDIV